MKKLITFVAAMLFCSTAWALDYAGATANGSITAVDKHIDIQHGIYDQEHNAIADLTIGYEYNHFLIQLHGSARGQWSDADTAFDLEEYSGGVSVGGTFGGFDLTVGDRYLVFTDMDNVNEVYVSADGSWAYGGFNLTAYQDTSDISNLDTLWVDGSVTATYFASLTVGASYNDGDIARYWGEVSKDFGTGLALTPFVRYETNKPSLESSNIDYTTVGLKASF